MAARWLALRRTTAVLSSCCVTLLLLLSSSVGVIVGVMIAAAVVVVTVSCGCLLIAVVVGVVGADGVEVVSLPNNGINKGKVLQSPMAAQNCRCKGINRSTSRMVQREPSKE